MKLLEIRQRVQDRLSDATSSTASIIDEKISETLEEISARYPTAKWLYRESSFNTLAQYVSSEAASETVQVQKGATLVLFTAASEVGKQWIGADFKVTGDSQSYRIEDIGLPNVTPSVDFAGTSSPISASAQWALLSHPYAGTSAAAATFELTQDTYHLRSDANLLEWMVAHEFPQMMVSVDPSVMRYYVPDPHKFGAAGIPWSMENLGRRTQVYLSSYSGASLAARAATATAVPGSNRVTLAAIEDGHAFGQLMFGVTNWDELLPGMVFRFEGEEAGYLIAAVEFTSSANTIVIQLQSRYAGTKTLASNFQIGPSEAPLVRLYSVPTGAERVSYGYYTRENFPLRDDEDRPYLPTEHHSVVLDGAIWRMLQFTDSQAQHQAGNRYLRGLDLIQKHTGARKDRTRQLRAHKTRQNDRLINLGENYPPLRIP